MTEWWQSTQYGVDEPTIRANNEDMAWLFQRSCLPAWSRMYWCNASGQARNLGVTKLYKYDVEIRGRLWSVWGKLHPDAPEFDVKTRGKQFLATNVMALCAVKLFKLTDWDVRILDKIVINGDKYHFESLPRINPLAHITGLYSMDELNPQCTYEDIKFDVTIECVAMGKLYCEPSNVVMNLAHALMYFFEHFAFGVVQCGKRSLAFGRTMGPDGGYFMFDCQSKEYPLFSKNEGAAYLLRAKHLQVLLYCIVLSLNVRCYNVDFTLHKVELSQVKSENA